MTSALNRIPFDASPMQPPRAGGSILPLEKRRRGLRG
jgi:hypothetical protein